MTALTRTTNEIGSAIEQVLIAGNLAQLSPEQRVSYYRRVCESLGLNPLTKPFEYLTLNGKLLLYARKDATEQLRRLNGVSIAIVAREVVEDVYVVTARATDKAGRSDESIGAVPIGGLKGEARANALMKAETKAKRRVTLSIAGLGMLDETEIDSIPGAQVTPVDVTPPKAQGTSAAAAAASTVQLPLTTAPTAAVSTDDEEAPDMVPVYIWKGEGSKKAGTLRGEWVQVDDEPKASHKQIALIHMLLRDLKLPEDDYRKTLLTYYGKDSSSLLSTGEASDVIDRMEKKKQLAAGKAQRQQQRFAREEADTEQRTLEQLQRERQAEVEDAFGVEVQG